MSPNELGKLCVEWVRQNGNDLDATIDHYAFVYRQDHGPIRDAAQREIDRLARLGVALPPGLTATVA